jgi:hypothetical protein
LRLVLVRVCLSFGDDYMCATTGGQSTKFSAALEEPKRHLRRQDQAHPDTLAARVAERAIVILPRMAFARELVQLYLDTNVFDHVLAAGEADRLATWLQAEGHTVLLSSMHLSEAIAIPDAAKRRELIAFLTGLPRRHLPPVGYLHAAELRAEVERCRPGWLRHFPDTSRVSYWLNGDKRRWVEAKRDPDRLAEQFLGSYRPVAEGGIAAVREAQKEMRQALVAGATHTPGFGFGGYEVATPGARLNDAELWWRRGCLTAWYTALILRPEVMRDYYDYLAPYLILDRIEEADFSRFWLNDADRLALRRNATASLIDWAQLRRKITHGNAADALHATYLFDADYLITGDRAFFEALTTLPDLGDAGLLVLTARSGTSAVEEIARAVGEATPRHELR